MCGCLVLRHELDGESVESVCFYTYIKWDARENIFLNHYYRHRHHPHHHYSEKT